MSNIINFHEPSFRKMKLTMGDDLDIVTDYLFGQKRYPNCRFVKVTRKGFNILNLDTNRMILTGHLYAEGMNGKRYPNKGSITRAFFVPAFLNVTKKIAEQSKS